MPNPPHVEKHFRASEMVRDIVIGMSDGLTVPIALAYIVGGLVPLAPYCVFGSVHTALIASVAVTLLALLVFGYIKGRFTTPRPARSAWQTAAVGGLAAAAAFLMARLAS